MKSIYMDKLPVAKKMSNKVICLPIYPDLDYGELQRIIGALIQL
jgi:dTDP-4-amino-4,6-dideoxygalactose transaminase